MNHRSTLLAWCGLATVSALAVSEPLMAACSGSERVVPDAMATISVESNHPLRSLAPHFFGFSFAWVEFQDSLWNATTAHVESQAVRWLKDFPGAVYRYPGGTESNYFDWRSAVGTTEQRPGRKLVKWNNSVVAKFGLDEYLDFVRDVGGQAWYVANLYGEFGRQGNARALAAEAGQLASYLRNKGSILRWELGNELDRGDYSWSVDKYVDVSRQVAGAIRHADPQARFVAIMEDYDANWHWKHQRAADYNREVAKGLADFTSEYAQHSYYDGLNVYVPLTVPNRIANICRSIDVAQQAAPAAGPVAIWVTEHARQPVKSAKNADWRPTWSKSANLEAALGVADFVIAATQVSEIQGLFAHALHGLSVPWPMFHKSKSGTQIHPSAVFWVLHMLRQGMESEVLRTVSSSPNLSGYAGGYDLRATILTNAQQTRWSIWVVNRSKQDQTATLTLPPLAGKTLQTSARVLGDNDLDANDYDDSTRLQPRDLPERNLAFDAGGISRIQIPGQSVVVVRLAAK